MKTLLLFAAILIAVFALKAQNEETPIEILFTELQNLNAQNTLNKIFIKTDKDVYAPGEKVWFKTDVMNVINQQHAAECKLVVIIRTASSDIVADGHYLALNGVASGQITIPGWCPEGSAYLIAYDPKSATTNDASLTGIKPITINQLNRNDYLVHSKLDKDIYKPGDEVKLQVKLNPISTSGKREKVSVTLFDYYKPISNIKENINIGELSLLKFKLPDDVENGLYFVIESANKNGFSKKVPVFTTKDQISIDFFVEGKNLLLNNSQRIVYRASDPFGNPVEISGEIFDESGNPAGMGKSLKKGLGVASLLPLPDHDYTFRISSEYGKGQKFEMPKPLVNGTAFTVIRTNENALRVAVLNSGNVIGQTLTLASIAQGEIKMAFDFVGEQKNSFQITTNELPLGVVNFIVLNKNGQIVSERMVFNYPNKDMNIEMDIKVAKIENKKEVELTFCVENFIKQFGASQFDIKVVDVQNLFNQNDEIQYSFLEYPLLTPTPKNMLDHYITNTEMIANRYRHFCLQDVLNKIDYAPKDNMNCLSGFVSDKNGQRIPNAMVMVTSPDNPTISTIRTDNNGQFYFPNITKNKNMAVKAISDNGKKSYTVHLHRSLYESLEELILFLSFKNFEPYLIESTPIYFANNESLVKIAGNETKDRKPAEISSNVKMLQSGASIIDVVRMIKPFTISGDKIIFAGGHNSFLAQDGALIVIDGQKLGTNISALNQVNPYDVVSINVSTNPVDIQQYTAFNTIGIIEINTKGTSNLSRIGGKEEEKIIPTSNKFDNAQIPKNIFKYQTTLLWEPNVQPDANGVITRNIKLSDLKTDFIVQIDALSADGITHSETVRFSTND